MTKTFDADTGAPVAADPVQPLTPIPSTQMASVINIPPQIAVTVCWVALGFAICWYMTRPKRRNDSI